MHGGIVYLNVLHLKSLVVVYMQQTRAEDTTLRGFHEYRDHIQVSARFVLKVITPFKCE